MKDCAGNRPCSGISERADRGSFNMFRNIGQEVNVFHRSPAIFDTGQYLFHPAGSFTAWAALTARFVVVKPGKCQEVFNHAGGIIHDNETSGAQHRS